MRYRLDMISLLILMVVGFLSSASGQSVRFAVIGDYGRAGQPELDVANLVKSWAPDFVITLGDNNYEDGADSTIDQNIGQYYSDFIFPYSGAFGSGDTINRFFPSLGNHDWRTTGATPYLNYFTLAGNERYYNVVKDPVHLFIIDSDTHEPDGTTSGSVQAQWLETQLGLSSSVWKIVYFHHPPFSSGTVHGSTPGMQWPFPSWGATAVLSGHEHNYERIVRNNFPYFVNGLGGRSLYKTFGTPVEGSVIRYGDDYGAMLVEADNDSIVYSFITRTGATIDTYVQYRPGLSTTQLTLAQGWNLVSLPAHVSDSSVSALFPNTTPHAFSYDGSAYESHDTLAPGVGYWIKSDHAQSVQLFGMQIHRDTIATSSDWNLIGTIADPISIDDIQQDPPNIIISSFFGYAGTYVAADSLFPGRAYWVKLSQQGKLILAPASTTPGQ